jgi:hypothetical protein
MLHHSVVMPIWKHYARYNYLAYNAITLRLPI